MRCISAKKADEIRTAGQWAPTSGHAACGQRKEGNSDRPQKEDRARSLWRKAASSPFECNQCSFSNQRRLAGAVLFPHLSFFVIKHLRPYRLAARAHPSQGWNRGSIPRKVMTTI